jgi:hypothetical protein
MVPDRLSLIQYPLPVLSLPVASLLTCYSVISQYSVCQKLK